MVAVFQGFDLGGKAVLDVFEYCEFLLDLG